MESSPSQTELLARHRAVIPNWVALYYEHPLHIVRGEGCYVWDEDGRRYLDFFGGILTTMVGHGIPEIQNAIREQAEKMVHISTVYLAEPMIELGEKITELSGIEDAKVFFTTSGTEAVDTSLLLASLFRRSNQVLAVRNSYHGRSFTAQAVTGNRSWKASGFAGLQVSFVNAARRRNVPFSRFEGDEFIAACVADLKDVLAIATSGDVACFIAEPIQGAGGFSHAPDGLFGEFKKVLDEHGILYISDEVQTGWGRTGENFWGYQAHDLVPDAITFAKGIANGMPLGGVIARAEIMDCLKVNSISTFGGNPIACAAALATIKYVEDNDLQTNSLKMGDRLQNGLKSIADDHTWIAEVRGKGLMLALEAEDPDTCEPLVSAVNAFHEAARERGLLIGRGGLWGNAVRISPPLSITEDQIDQALEIFSDSASLVSNKL